MLLPESHVSEVVVPTDLVREPLGTCVEVDECLLLRRPGEGGTGRSTQTRDDMPSVQPLQLQEFQLLSCPKVIHSSTSKASKLL